MADERDPKTHPADEEDQNEQSGGSRGATTNDPAGNPEGGQTQGSGGGDPDPGQTQGSGGGDQGGGGN